MLADTPKIDGSTRESRPRPEGLPVRRMGLEQEFFLVDRKGELCDLADLFLWKCREAARARGLDPRCFVAESVKSLVEITTPPSYSVGEMVRREIVESFPDRGASLTREQGLSLVRDACPRMDEQVATLRRKYDEAPPENEVDQSVARVIDIRSSPTISAQEVHPVSMLDARRSARAANKELA